MLTPSTLVFYTSYLWALSQALQVSPNSTCAAVCLDHPDGDPLDPAASTTNYTDIACRDADYLTSSTGIKFKNCVECLQDSRNVNSGENDISWFLCKPYPKPRFKQASVLMRRSRQPSIRHRRLLIWISRRGYEYQLAV